eukprot:m.145151 g.145151  ORF g.145151 m.145151 type:complete len:647 (+) comp38413_c0_seq1:82-2022(+)
MLKILTVLIAAAFVVAGVRAQETTFSFRIIPGSCTATCGFAGFLPSLVACTTSTGRSVDEVNCAGQPRPPSPPLRACNRRPCPGIWVVPGDWGNCSAECNGNQTRTIECHQELLTGDINRMPTADVIPDQVVDDINCLRPKPASSRPCGGTCFTFAWSVGEWGACSSGCGPGTQTRAVSCERSSSENDDKVPVIDSECEREVTAERDAESRPCDVNCRFVYGNWSGCQFPSGDTCGVGTESRDVTCLDEDAGTAVNERFCNEDATITDERPPIRQRRCEVECPCLNPRWESSEWGTCSVSCGNGTQSRDVICRCLLGRNDAVVNDTECDAKAITERLPAVQRCGDRCPCLSPRWETSEFGVCSQTCGGGRSTRKVQCRCRRGEEDADESDATCAGIGAKPAEAVDCSVDDCPCTDPRWTTGPLSPCILPCGGFQTRDVVCRCPIVTKDGTIENSVNDSFCDSLLIQTKPVSAFPCPQQCSYSLEAVTAWTECSVSCGEGIRTRSVDCVVRVNSPTGDIVGKTERRICSNGTVASEEICSGVIPTGVPIWVASKWSSCSNTCNGGLKKRKVRCVDKCTGEVAVGCPVNRRPRHKQQCKCVPCERAEAKDKPGYPCNIVQTFGLCRVMGCKLQAWCGNSCWFDVVKQA